MSNRVGATKCVTWALGAGCLLAACGTSPLKAGRDAAPADAAGLAEVGAAVDAGAAPDTGAGTDARVDAGASADAGTVPTDGRPYTALAMTVGVEHACALLDNHRVKCWGFNRNGELGLGDGFRRGSIPAEMGNALPFVDLGTGRTATAIAAGGETTCAILDDGSVKCWGLGDLTGQPSPDNKGDDPNEMGDALPPLDLGAGRKAVLITLSSTDACAILDDGTARCWGAHAPARVPTPVALGSTSPVRALAPSWPGLTVLFADGHVGGLLGQPIPPEWGQGIAAIDGAGPTNLDNGGPTGGTECAILTDGTILCSYIDPPGSLIEGATFLTEYPKLFQTVTPPPPALAIGISTPTCILAKGGAVQCGYYPCQDLACTPDWCQSLASGPDEVGPILVNFGHPAVAISSGAQDFTCALLSNGAVRCFGLSLPNVPNDELGSSFDFMETGGVYSYGAFHDIDLGEVVE
jgi:prepilin-type processing-associated H-X9-DG protein